MSRDTQTQQTQPPLQGPKQTSGKSITVLALTSAQRGWVHEHWIHVNSLVRPWSSSIGHQTLAPQAQWSRAFTWHFYLSENSEGAGV